MKWIIDRIENGTAVCEIEDCGTIDVILKALPKEVKEGDVLNISVDSTETENRKKKINKLMNDLFKD